MAWTQEGDPSRFRFRAYVDDRPVELVSATCDRATPATCTSQLPPLTDGLHTLAIVSVDQSGVESARSNVITVRKSSTRPTVSAAMRLRNATAAGVSVDTVVDAGDGLLFGVDVVARGVGAPTQLAWLPDGRLLSAESSGLVRVIRPGHATITEPALDARALLRPSPAGPLGIARHPDFLQSHFVYVGFIDRERDDRGRLYMVRLREVNDTLGEPASLFEAPVAADASLPLDARTHVLTREAPRMAFGPDGLLYLSLPPGLEFQNEPAASTPRASMLRLSDDGTLPAAGALTGVDAHPIGFTWDPFGDALWLLFPGLDGEPVVRTLGDTRTGTAARTWRSGLLALAGSGRAPGALQAQGTGAGALAVVRALTSSPANGKERPLRLAMPVVSGAPLQGAFDQMNDAVVDGAGTVFVAVDDVVLRLTPRRR